MGKWLKCLFYLNRYIFNLICYVFILNYFTGTLDLFTKLLLLTSFLFSFWFCKASCPPHIQTENHNDHSAKDHSGHSRNYRMQDGVKRRYCEHENR